MPRRIGLVGCVKKKLDVDARAKDLYISPLFRGRRHYVERSCDEWWILSAEHGLVDPEQVLAPYDVTLKDMGRAERRAWARRVLDELEASTLLSPSDVVEIHAGADYRDYGLVDGLRRMGCAVEVPTEGLTQGPQLRFYKNARPEADPDSG